MRGLLILGALLASCGNEGPFTTWEIEAVAVTIGDFDNATAPFARRGVSHQRYEGVISKAMWEDDQEAAERTVETLLGDPGELRRYDAVVLASGTRGMGRTEYNGTGTDDLLVSDQAIVDNLKDYVDGGGVLVATDWTYDMVEAAWPDFLEFVGDDGVLDAAQTGAAGTVASDVVEPLLEASTELDKLVLEYNFSRHVVIESAGYGARVWLTGDVAYTDPDRGSQTLRDSPLMVTWDPPTGDGRVVMMTFNIDAQPDQVIDTLLNSTVGELVPETADAR